MNSSCAEMVETKLGMSNLDLEIDKGFEEQLRSSPNKIFGRHSAWNFNGLVWFNGKQFCEEVWVFHIKQETFYADSLEELMNTVNAKYGSK